MLPAPERPGYAVGDGSCRGVKLCVKEGVVTVVVDKAYFDKNGGHPALSEDHQVGTGIDAKIFVADPFQLPVDVCRYGAGREPFIVYKTFHAGILIGIRAGVAVNGDKDICPGGIPFCRLLIGGLVDIFCPGVDGAEAVAFKNSADSKREAKGIVLFLSAVLDRAWIRAAVPGIKKNSVDVISHVWITCEKSFFPDNIWKRICPGHRAAGKYRSSEDASDFP